MSVVRVIEIKKKVCPAEFDTGSSCNAMILSVPEGDDKGVKNLRACLTARR